MKILIWSNAPWASTGYGIQTKELVARFQEMGHEVAVVANFGLQGGSLNWGGTMIYPAREKPLAIDMIGFYAQHFGADVVLSLYDIWALAEDTRQRFKPPWIAWIPVDGAPVSPMMRSVAKTAEYTAAFSRFGQAELKKAGIEAWYIPLGIDAEVFKPGDKGKAREALGVDGDTFLVVTVAANKGYPARKAWPEMLTAFGRFRARHEEAVLYLHTTRQPFGSGGIGIYFNSLIQALEIPERSVAFADEGEMAVGVPSEQMAQIYQAADVLLLPSMGEGFGLPVVEAQACGCPVITGQCSAMTELTVYGLALEPLQPLWVPQLQYWWQIPNIIRIDGALEDAYWQLLSSLTVTAQEGSDTMRERYDWPVVMRKYWQPFLEHVEDTLW